MRHALAGQAGRRKADPQIEPQMDGHAVARALRARHGRALRVIALTGYGRPEDRERSGAAGFDAHLVKPIELQALRCHLAG